MLNVMRRILPPQGLAEHNQSAVLDAERKRRRSTVRAFSADTG